MTAGEKNIIVRCQEGDVKAQFLLYKQYSKAMYNIAIRFLNNTMDAEDILQESFLSAFEKIDGLANTSSFGSWLKRIVINNCLTLLRKKKMYFEDIEDYKLDDPDDSDSFADIDPVVVHREIKSLPDGGRTILVLHALEGYKHREIAKMMGISESTSRTQYKRALGILNKNIKEKVYVN
jgi:RNA polymerase sigma-70 factor (ECF subfamily)